MCKVAAVTGITDDNRDRVWEFLKNLGSIITPGNDNGLGYAAFDKKGNIFGERWLRNLDAFRDPTYVNKMIAIGLPIRQPYNWFGNKVVRDQARGIILHTRAASGNNVHILNTHPFTHPQERPKTALIHNGYITNHDDLTIKYSSCDSESVLHEYIKQECNKDPKNIQKLADEVVGWYTCLALTKDSDGKPIIDIFTDGGRLASYYVPQLKCRVYSSEEYDIREACSFFGYEYQKGFQFKPGMIRRLDADSGKILFSGKFDPHKNFVDDHGDYTDEFWYKLTGMRLNEDDEETVGE